MKKYSEHFINNQDILKFARIGFEFEFYMKENSYYKTMELLNQYLSPVKVWGFRKYHSSFKPDSKNFKIEPDLSGGSNMVELVTGPMEYYEAKFYLVKILKFINDFGTTNEKSSIHFNISFIDECDKNLNSLNILKLILNTDEDEIYNQFPSRKGNVYAKSVKNIIPFREYDFNDIGIDTIKNILNLPNDKYYGINFSNVINPKETQRIEFRYIGGKGYHLNIGQVIYFMERFIINTWNSISSDFNDADVIKLEKYLKEKIDRMYTFSRLDEFIINYPSINLQIDQNSNYDQVNSQYDKIFNDLYNLIDSVDFLQDCILNYVSSDNKLEIIDAKVKLIKNIEGYDFINCEILSGIFENCNMINSKISDSQIIKSKIWGCEAMGSKILNCKVEKSILNYCFFVNGYLDSDMIGGVFRSGELGPYANISSQTKIVTEEGNFFDTKFDQGEKSFPDEKNSKKNNN